MILISKEEGGFKACIEKADILAKQINGYRPNQFSNKLNTECHYKYTGLEILNQIKKEIGGYVSGIGSGGTLMGIGTRLKETYPNIKIAAVEPLQMPLLTTNKIIGNHKIEGIGDDFIPDLVDKKIIDTVYDIDDEDAINMARLLNKKLGLGVGISSGANLLGAVLLNEKIDKIVVTIFPDDNKKYLSTDYSDKHEILDSYLTKDIELIDVIAIK